MVTQHDAPLETDDDAFAPAPFTSSETLDRLVDDCVHCGFCLPTCPTYSLWGEEMDSPRGRIHLVEQAASSGRLPESTVGHLDACLGCMACVTACPSGVKYDQIIERARADEATAMLGQATEVADVDTAALARIDAGDDDVVVKVAVPLTGVTAALVTARDVEQRHQVACRVQGSAGAGVLTAVVTGGAEGAAAAVEDLRAAATGGSAVVLQAPPAVRERVDSWGPVGGLDLMRRVKDEFDPEHRFAPGRFVGGI